MSGRSRSSTGSKRPLIARLWHGAVPATKGDDYAAYLRRTGVTECRATPGTHGVEVLRRTVGGETHFLFISFWDSMDAIRIFAGDECRAGPLLSRESGLSARVGADRHELRSVLAVARLIRALAPDRPAAARRVAPEAPVFLPRCT